VHNGPAVELVNVAERMKAGAENPLRGRIRVPAVMSEARRGFCRHGTKFSCVLVRSRYKLSGEQ